MANDILSLVSDTLKFVQVRLPSLVSHSEDQSLLLLSIQGAIDQSIHQIHLIQNSGSSLPLPVFSIQASPSIDSQPDLPSDWLYDIEDRVDEPLPSGVHTFPPSIDDTLKQFVIVEPTQTLLINRRYIVDSDLIDYKILHRLMTWFIGQFRKFDGSLFSISGHAKFCPSLFIQTLVYLHRPGKFRSGLWMPAVNPVFRSPDDLNYFIQKYKLLISHFYHYTCTGRTDNGEYLLERRVTVITDDELTSRYARRLLIKKWEHLIDYSI